MWHNTKFTLIVMQCFTLKKALALQTNLQDISSFFLLIEVISMLNIFLILTQLPAE